MRDPDWRQAHQHMECLARTSSIPCQGDVVGHHILLGWMTKSDKPPDDRLIPLCFAHHRQLHDMGEKTFYVWLFNEDRQALTEVMHLAARLKYEEWKRGEQKT